MAEHEAYKYYRIIGDYFNWKVDAVYEDTIVELIGSYGLALMRRFRLMEPCGVINGRKLYAL